MLQFPDLQTLEIRGTGSNRNLIFYIDEPMATIKHVNFEAIKLIADEKLAKMRKANQHPSEVYDYVPESERNTYNVEIEMEEEIEIVPYDVYLMEIAKSKRATFIDWDELEVLRIHNCHLDEINWEMFDGLSKLQHLSLEHNEIKVIPAFAFYGALHIKTLSLARNSILDLHYRALAGLLELENLDLSDNNMTKLSESTFPPFPSLDTVDLRNNPIEFILPMSFAIMNATKSLTLGSEAVALDLTAGVGGFMALDQLNSLNILNVRAPSLSQTMFVGLKSLERLKLKGAIERIEFDAFAEMPRLKELILSGCGIFEISMDAFYGIKDLRVLDLSNNQLFLIPPGVFDEQKRISEVYLQKNQLTNMPKKFFSIPSLKLVRLIDNPWICSCEMTEWNQAITNSIRTTQSTSTATDNCIQNPKTGRLESCDSQFDNFPKYSYGFDNKMTPLCNDGTNKHKNHSVYYSLRHNIKCSQPPIKSSSDTAEKQRIQNKLDFTLAKLARTQKQSQKTANQNSAQQLNGKMMRKKQFDNKVRRTLHHNAKILKEQVHSNDIAYYLH